MLPRSTLLLLLFFSAASGRLATADDAVDFSRQIRPILSDKCFKCHGPDKSSRKADLRLDVRSEAADALELDDNTSALIDRITSDDPDERMPPPKSKIRLTDEQVKLLKRWNLQGAKYERHWAFQPVRAVAPPEVRQADWPTNSIDRFILAGLERRKLKPAPAADRETLIRRLSFDLTGLPPTLKEIDQFLGDPSANAYEKLVDRLLEKTAYGERMASIWLDLARYSDSYGYQVDRDRFVWPWRDWVIKAFNNNMPFDQFVTWQLAGDLLPNATDDHLLATTFNRLHPQKVEGGSTPEEFRVEYVADRNHTFGTAFLGLTIECARCHDHKFDPISQQEYYQLFAFFNNIDEAGLYSYFTSSVPTPTLLLTDQATKDKIASIQKRILSAEQKLAEIASAREAAFEKWLAARPAEAKVGGRVEHRHFDDFKSGANKSVPGRVGKAVQLTGDDAIGLRSGNFQRSDPFSIALWMNTPDVKSRAIVLHRSRAWTDAGSRGYQLLIENGQLSASLIHFWPGNAIRIRTRKKLPTDQWLHVTITYDGSSRAAGLRLFLNGRPAPCDVVQDNLYKNITGGGGNNIAIGARFRDRGFTQGKVDEVEVYNRQLTSAEVAQLHDKTTLTKLLAIPAKKLDELKRLQLKRYYLATVDAEYIKQVAQVHMVRQQRSRAVDGVQEIMVMRERQIRRPSFVLKRGLYSQPTEPVEPGTPAVLPPFPADQPKNRLGLARWLTQADHPLTSRVAVNRLWQMCFGHGLLRTPEDFGSQGQPPSHPALLDWLASDFASHQWNVKRVLKAIVMSATYRQSAAADARTLELDPENRWLARAPRYRWPAEMLRDNALATSRLLVDKQGGAPARPYELEASFKPMKRQGGASLYRRSVYTYWKRTAPAPVMMALDASKRDVCRVKRERTASPVQAFVLLNDPQFVEAARMLAQRILVTRGADDHEALVVDTFRILTSRRPTRAESALLLQLFREQLAYFETNPDRAKAYLQTGDAASDAKLPAAPLAALGVVANTLMSFDHCVMKR